MKCHASCGTEGGTESGSVSTYSSLSYSMFQRLFVKVTGVDRDILATKFFGCSAAESKLYEVST